MVHLEAELITRQANCPSCRFVSTKVHDRYVRRPFDLPWRGCTARLKLTVRRFRCTNPDCGRATFAEDCGPRLPRFARRTLEAHKHLVKVAIALGGEAGARIANGEGLPVSPDTLLRMLRRNPIPIVSAPRVLGVDDFALRHGHTYGSIFVDIESRRPIDMVEGREADKLANWLKEHPGVEIITRDRSGAYAEGARVGAPNAIQVADRFHLVHNASDALDRMLRRRSLMIEKAETSGEIEVPAPNPEDTVSDKLTPLSPTKQRLTERHTARVARWERVNALAKAGARISHIAREVGIARKTVRDLIATPEAPQSRALNRAPSGLSSPILQPFISYLQDRWQNGCTNASQLYREISGRGYSGSYTLLTQTVSAWRLPRLPAKRRQKVRREPKRAEPRRLTMRWICLRPPEQLKPEEKLRLEKLLDQDAELALGHKLLQEFRRIVADRDLVGLENWLGQAKSSDLHAFVRLANGIERDRDAVNAGLELPWSNGPTEGHVNRLKLIKRQGYGRAKFDLLRARVLAA